MLNTEEQEIHERAVKFSKQLQTADAPLLRALRDAYESKLFLKFNRTGLFRYAVDILKHDEAVARPYITVAKKCAEFPQVLIAIEAGKFPVAKALRFVSVLKPTNVEEFIEYATTLNYEDLNHKVAAENPQKKKRSIHKPVGENKVRASYDFDREFATELKTEAKRLNLDPAEVLKRAFYELRERIDPVRKAERAKARRLKPKFKQPPKELCVNKIPIAKRNQYRPRPHTRSSSGTAIDAPRSMKMARDAKTQSGCTFITSNEWRMGARTSSAISPPFAQSTTSYTINSNLNSGRESDQTDSGEHGPTTLCAHSFGGGH